MTFFELLQYLNHEYIGRLDAQEREARQGGRPVTLTDSFYDFVVSQGVSRHTLSAHGYSRADLDGNDDDELTA